MNNWEFPVLTSQAYQGGDMPGDKINIGQSHISRAEKMIPPIKDWLKGETDDKIVLSVYGGSGVGKSEIGSLLAYYLRETGSPTYLLSGDNYPLRIPEDNDKERLRIFRHGVLSALSRDKSFSESKMNELKDIWDKNDDFENQGDYWNQFRDAGLKSLKAYLATENEIDFSLINHIIQQFKQGASTIPLKRMGRVFDSVFMEPVDFTSTRVLIIEWTHGNNPLLKGVDHSIFLYSTPEETLAHRRSRARDKNVDSPFVSMVLALEQDILMKQLDSASLIVSLKGEILSPKDLRRNAHDSK
jgi:uridine kinase